VPGRNMPFAVDEFKARLGKVQAALRERGWVGLMLHTPENIYYLTGYQTSGYFAYQVVFVPATGEPLLLVRQLEQTNAEEFSWLEPAQQAVYLDIEDPIEVTHRALTKQGWADGPVGVEKNSWYFTIQQFEQLSALAPKTKFVDGSSIVDRYRLIKSPAEIRYARRAAELSGMGMQAAIDTLAVGRTENEVAAAVHEAEIRNGCEYTGLPHFVSSGYRIKIGHANWSDKRIERGDLIHLELSGCVKRYSAVMMRTAIMGPPSAEVQRAVDILISSQDQAISLMKPGVPAGEVDAAVRQPVLKAGLRETYNPRVGYSIGIGFPPRWGEWATRDFMAGDTWRLEAGMVFHMIVNANGICFSETVLVTETGHEILTKFERKLFVK
jgi:Xaa-Pro aminopeptidase